jgi:ABC-type Zn uptake system ZnuABC Zn-binding protein ZnuA
MFAPAGITRRAMVACALPVIGSRASALPLDVCSSRQRVVATTSDLASLVVTVGGDLVQVQSIVPPSADPESFEPRASDLALISDAALVVKVGLGYEHWLEKLLGRSGRISRLGEPDSVIDVSSGIPLLEVNGRDPFANNTHAHGMANPHYWLDPANAETMTATIGAALARSSALRREVVLENRKLFLDQLHHRMDAWVRTLAPFRGAAVLAYHNSWPYFARRFHLNIVGFIEPKEGVTPSVAHLASLLSQAKQSNIRAILQKTNEPTRFSEAVATRLSVPLVKLAPAVGSVPQATDYLSLMEYNVNALARALGAAQ